MTKDEYNKLFEYLKSNCEAVGQHFEEEDGAYTGKFHSESSHDCKIRLFENIFATTIHCDQYDVVAHGEGNEEEKIDSVYSSSLQSLLAFCGVDKSHPIRIEVNGEVYSFGRVHFEYKNEVIGYPSSVDVVLVDEEKKAIAFIESKFLEIVRDSTKKAKKVIGVSYFGLNVDGGYKKVFNLENEDYKNIGIVGPKQNINGAGNFYLEEVKGQSEHKGSVSPIGKNSYVYAEGIKQILSHIIGIQNFKKNVRAYDKTTDPLGDIDGGEYKIFYIELYNELPELEFAEKVLEDFKNHAEKVKEILDKKEGLYDGFLLMSYQDLFGGKLNQKCAVSQRVREYYRFDK